MHSAYERPRDFLAVIQTGLLALLVLVAGVHVVQNFFQHRQQWAWSQIEARGEAGQQASILRQQQEQELQRKHQAVLQRRKEREALMLAERARLEGLAATLVAPLGGIAVCDLKYEITGSSTTSTDGMVISESLDWEYKYENSVLRVVLTSAPRDEKALVEALAHITRFQPKNILVKRSFESGTPGNE